MANIAVVGAASTVGQVALTALMRAGHRVLAVDTQRPDVVAPFRRTNVDGTVRPGALRDVDVAVHLLAGHQPSRDVGHDAAADVESTRSLLRAAEDAGPRALVLVSSATVYGAHEDNPLPLRDDAPLRADPEFPFAWHKRLADELVSAWARAHPQVRVVVLRPVTVLGAGHDDFVARHLEAPRLPLVRGHTPPMQALDAEDLAEAVLLACEGELSGAYNVAPEGWLTAREVCDILGRKPLPVPESVAFPLAERLWASRLAPAPAGGLRYLMHPWVVDAGRLREAGWAARSTNREVLARFAAAHRRHLAVGPVRTSRRAVAVTGLAAGTAAGLAGRAALRHLRRA